MARKKSRGKVLAKLDLIGVSLSVEPITLPPDASGVSRVVAGHTRVALHLQLPDGTATSVDIPVETYVTYFRKYVLPDFEPDVCPTCKQEK